MVSAVCLCSGNEYFQVLFLSVEKGRIVNIAYFVGLDFYFNDESTYFPLFF